MFKNSIASIIILSLILMSIVDEYLFICFLLFFSENGGETYNISILLLLQFVPLLIFSIPGGAFADKYGGYGTLKYFSPLAIIVIFLIGMFPSIQAIYVGAFISSALFCYIGPSIFQLIPNFAEKLNLELSYVNKIIEISKAIGGIFGPIIGALAFGAFDFGVSLLFISFVYLCAFSVILILSKNIDDHDRQQGENNPNKSINYKPILRNKRGLYCFFIFGFIVFSTTLSDVVYIFFARNYLEIAIFYTGLLMSAWAVGIVFSGGIYTYFGKRYLSTQIAFGGSLIMGIAILSTGIIAVLSQGNITIIVIAIAFLIGGIGNGLHNISVRNTIYDIYPKGQFGRAYSFYQLIARTGSVIGYVTGGMFIGSLSVVAYIVSGIIAILGSFFGLNFSKTNRLPGEKTNV